MSELLRVTLHLVRDDCPPLFDELSTLPKGRRRTSRLRNLALLGMKREESIARGQQPGDKVGRDKPKPHAGDAPDSTMSAAAELFGTPSGGAF